MYQLFQKTSIELNDTAYRINRKYEDVPTVLSNSKYLNEDKINTMLLNGIQTILKVIHKMDVCLKIVD